MSTFTNSLASGANLVWIDSYDYAKALLGGGTIPWLDLSEAVAWQRKVQSLLPSDVVPVPVERVAQAWCAAHGETLEAMRAKKRAGAALRTLLADAGLRRQLVELTKGLRSCFGGKALALVVPAPARWLTLAHEAAFGEPLADIDADLADSAAVYIADFLREFAETGLDVVLIDEGGASPLSPADAISILTPVFNLAEHYRWVVGVKTATAEGLETAAGPGFFVAPAAVPGHTSGLAIGADFWAGSAAPERPAGGFRYLTIPEGHNPESVLERVATLR